MNISTKKSRLEIGAESTGRARSSEAGPRAMGLRGGGGAWSRLPVMPLTDQFDRRSSVKVKFH